MAIYFDVGSDIVCFAPFTCTDNVPGRHLFGESETRMPDLGVFFP